MESLILVGAGIFAGALNTIAGGGSFLSLPALIFVGVPANIANGSNRISVILQSIVGAWALHRRAPFPVRRTLTLAIPASVGSVVGASVAIHLDAAATRTAIGVALLGGAVLLAARPRHWLENRSSDAASAGASGSERAAPGVVFALVVAGFYGGFLQAGVGAILLLVLAGVGGWDLLEATGAKSLLVACFTLPALVVFAWDGLVSWQAGLLLGVGTVAGAEIGARIAVRGGRKLILGAIVIALVLAAIKLLDLV